MLTKEEFKKEFVRMMDSLRDDDVPKGTVGCTGVSCHDCPLRNICTGDANIRFLSFEIIEAVENWSKEHPVTTYKDKFKEVFGAEPKDVFGTIPCPFTFGFMTEEQCLDIEMCDVCKDKFWNSEYKPPVVTESEVRG